MFESVACLWINQPSNVKIIFYWKYHLGPLQRITDPLNYELMRFITWTELQYGHKIYIFQVDANGRPQTNSWNKCGESLQLARSLQWENN